MSRTLMLVLLVGCAGSQGVARPAAPAPTPPAPTPVDDRPPFETWAGWWTDARACLVSPSEDLLEGVTLAMQSGRDCTSKLHRLDLPLRVDEQLLAVWNLTLVMVREAERATVPSKRVEQIQLIDHTIKELRGLVEDSPANCQRRCDRRNYASNRRVSRAMRDACRGFFFLLWSSCLGVQMQNLSMESSHGSIAGATPVAALSNPPRTLQLVLHWRGLLVAGARSRLVTIRRRSRSSTTSGARRITSFGPSILALCLRCKH